MAGGRDRRMKTPVEINRERLRLELRDALPYTPGQADRLADAIDAYAEAWHRETLDKASDIAAVERALETMAPPTDPPTEPKRNAIPPPALDTPSGNPDAWIITNERGDALHEVYEHEANALANAANWYGDTDAPVVHYVPADRLLEVEQQLEESREHVRKLGEFFHAATKCPGCGSEDCEVDQTPGAETMRCAACGVDRWDSPVSRVAYDRLRKALEEIASGNGSDWVTGVAARALKGPSIVVEPAPGDRCGNTGQLPGGGECPGCRSCA